MCAPAERPNRVSVDRRRLVLGAVLALGTRLSARGDPGRYPARPLKIIVPSSAGGVVDVHVRRIAERLSRTVKQPALIDNRPGASNTIGIGLGAKSAPDGYTITVVTSSGLAVAPAFGMPLPYHPVSDFIPITQYISSPLVLVVSTSFPARDVRTLIALAKAKPGTLTYASTGHASTNHIAGELFARSAGVELIHVPYKGNAPALPDLISNRVNLSFDYPATSKSLVQAGKLRALMVSSKSRIPILPDVPTSREAGYPEVDIRPWAGFSVPQATPGDIVTQLYAELIKAIQDQEVRRQLEEEGALATSSSPAAFRQFIVEEQDKYKGIVQALRIRLED
jgi:tripartite-type tricarboxylate transporter receptor subunit TctC